MIVCTDKEQVLYQHLEHKGHDGLSQTPVKNFDGTVIHDHDKTYYSYGSSHQECLAHVLRYLVGAAEAEPHICDALTIIETAKSNIAIFMTLSRLRL